MSFSPSLPRVFLERELARLLRSLPDGGRLLNVGGGVEGRYADLLERFDVDCIDVIAARTSQPWRQHQCDAARMPFADECFDAAVAIESFEHIPDNRSAMRETLRTLRPGGLFIVTTPTADTWIFEFGRHGPHYYTADSLRRLIVDAGGEVISFSACGGAIYFLANLIKSWLSPLGIRLLRSRWWPVIDGVLAPLYGLAILLDRVLCVLPSNYAVLARKPMPKNLG